METKADFNLSHAVALWRQELVAQGEFLPEEIRELESHLHLSIDGLNQRGLKEEEAFWLARRRLGPGQLISQEFACAKPYRLWQSRIHWLRAGVVGGYLCTTALSLSSSLAKGNFGRWVAETVVLALLTGGAIWLAATSAHTFSRRLAGIFSSPWRRTLGWLLLSVTGFLIGWRFAGSPGQGDGPIGVGLMIGWGIGVRMVSLIGACAAVLVVLMTAGLEWRWKKLAAKEVVLT